jgi:hypothetical protein
MSDWCWPHQGKMAVIRLRSVHHDRQIELFIVLCGWSRYQMADTNGSPYLFVCDDIISEVHKS